VVTDLANLAKHFPTGAQLVPLAAREAFSLANITLFTAKLVVTDLGNLAKHFPTGAQLVPLAAREAFSLANITLFTSPSEWDTQGLCNPAAFPPGPRPSKIVVTRYGNLH
jgi:hypothetical protein